MSLYKLQFVPEPSRVEVKGIVDIGGFNTMPEPWSECTQADFYRVRALRKGNGLEYRQIMKTRDFAVAFLGERSVRKNVDFSGQPSDWFPSIDVFVWWYDDAAYVEVPPCHGHPARYFKCGCYHKGEETLASILANRDNPHWCLHDLVCTECGATKTTDSSG